MIVIVLAKDEETHRPMFLYEVNYENSIEACLMINIASHMCRQQIYKHIIYLHV